MVGNGLVGRYIRYRCDRVRMGGMSDGADGGGMELEPGLVFYVDEAGQLDFRERRPEARATPFIACAVLLPTYRREALLAMLPKHPVTGQPMKSTDREMAPAMEVGIVRQLMGTDFYAGMVLIDTSAPDSVSVARDATTMANRRRRSEHRPKIKLPNLMYEVFVADAVANAWKAYSTIHQEFLGFGDVVLDDKPIPAHLREEVARSLTSAFASQGMRIRTVRWASEQDEPLLLFPDHLAGLVHRNVTRKECVEPWDLLEPARRSGRLSIQDGKKFLTLPANVGPEEPPPSSKNPG
jgi:hypothetical protein